MFEDVFRNSVNLPDVRQKGVGMRTALRVHPARCDKTSGCIGVVAGKAEQLSLYRLLHEAGGRFLVLVKFKEHAVADTF